MKNIFVYDRFIETDDVFRLRYIKISLIRTKIFDIGRKRKNAYRKNSIRKIVLVGKEKRFSCNRLDLSCISKYKMSDISNILYEYVRSERIMNPFYDNRYDIAIKEKKQKVVVDSISKREKQEEIVTMFFDEVNVNKDYSNMLWINNSASMYSNINA